MQQSDKSILLTEDEIKTLEDVFYLEPWLQDAVDYRRRKGNKYKLKLIGDDLRDCVDALMYHEKFKGDRQKKYATLARKISQYESRNPASYLN
jgi:hypothetical protein